MNVFAVIAARRDSVNEISNAVESKFSGNFLKAGDMLWFIADGGTVYETAVKLGVKTRDTEGLDHIILLPVTSYWGWTSVSTWEWLKNKLESK